MKCLVAVIGPTAVGKSQLALHLAQDFDGEIVNADSRQIYRYMDIGTAKPSRQELSLVLHHLVDIINPNQDLMQVDPVAAQKIDRRNVRRMIRALEVSRHAEAPFSQLQRKQTPPFDA